MDKLYETSQVSNILLKLSKLSLLLIILSGSKTKLTLI